MPLENVLRNMGILGTGAIGSSLGQIFEPFDYPRRALYNLFKQPDDFDWKAMIPGLLGTAAGAGLAATGVGLPMALLGGSLLGGAVQGAGEATNPELYRAHTPGDLYGAMGGNPDSMLGSTIAGMATDPLTFAGFASGSRLAGLGKRHDLARMTPWHSGSPGLRPPSDHITSLLGRP